MDSRVVIFVYICLARCSRGKALRGKDNAVLDDQASALRCLILVISDLAGNGFNAGDLCGSVIDFFASSPSCGSAELNPAAA